MNHMRKSIAPGVLTIPGALAFIGWLALTGGGALAQEASISYFLKVPEDSLAFTGGTGMNFGGFPPGIPTFSEPRIANGLAVLAKLRNAAGEIVGFASELEVFPEGGLRNFGSQNVIWDTVWTLMIPGRGSLYLAQQEHSGEMAAETIARARETGETWTGNQSMTTTVGPSADGRGLILGGTGDFAGASGSFVEIGTMHSVTPAGEMHMTVELRLFMETAAKGGE